LIFRLEIPKTVLLRFLAVLPPSDDETPGMGPTPAKYSTEEIETCLRVGGQRDPDGKAPNDQPEVVGVFSTKGVICPAGCLQVKKRGRDKISPEGVELRGYLLIEIPV